VDRFFKNRDAVTSVTVLARSNKRRPFTGWRIIEEDSMKIEDLLYYPTIQTYEWDEAVYLLKHKSDDLELWLVAVPLGDRCEIADELFVRYGDDKDLTQEVVELIELVKKDGKLMLIKEEI
jgi:hypothetical protein